MEDINQWREELESLHQQAETSLLIVDTMSGVFSVTICVCHVLLLVCLCLSECVQLIMEDAKKKKRDWQQLLHDLKLMNLLQLRDSLMATASIHMMRVEDCKASDQVTHPLTQSTFLCLQIHLHCVLCLISDHQ